MPKGHLIVLSLDGLAAHDLPFLYKLMPETAKHLAQLQLTDLNCTPLVSAQAIWAELLTGRPWFESGCAGFSRPDGTLQKFEIFTEDDLLASVDLLANVKSIVINVPLLKPVDGDRVFLSDGSTRSPQIVSPPRLMQEHEILRHYRPRPYASPVHAISYKSEAFRKCLDVERLRLNCAQSLIKDCAWDRVLLRLSLFDHLAHLFGADVLMQTNLRIYDQLRSFLAEFDRELSTMISQFPEADLCVLSAYSHVRGLMRANVNCMLENTGLLENNPNSETVVTRGKAIAAAVSGMQKSAGIKSARQVFCSSRTRAVSPVSGCIFINDVQRFRDGSVSLSEFEATKSRVIDLLHNRLAKRLDCPLTIVPNPIAGRNDSIAPDIVLYAEGVEFCDALDDVVDFNAQRAVHAPRGFVFLPRQLAAKANEVNTPVGLAAILSS